MTGCKLVHRKPDARRALVLLAEPRAVQPLVRTLESGSFVVRVARSLAEAEAILAGWRPDLAVVDMEHDDSRALRTEGSARTARASVMDMRLLGSSVRVISEGSSH